MAMLSMSSLRGSSATCERVWRRKKPNVRACATQGYVHVCGSFWRTRRTLPVSRWRGPLRCTPTRLSVKRPGTSGRTCPSMAWVSFKTAAGSTGLLRRSRGAGHGLCHCLGLHEPKTHVFPVKATWICVGRVSHCCRKSNQNDYGLLDERLTACGIIPSHPDNSHIDVVPMRLVIAIVILRAITVSMAVNICVASATSLAWVIAMWPSMPKPPTPPTLRRSQGAFMGRKARSSCTHRAV